MTLSAQQTEVLNALAMMPRGVPDRVMFALREIDAAELLALSFYGYITSDEQMPMGKGEPVAMVRVSRKGLAEIGALA